MTVNNDQKIRDSKKLSILFLNLPTGSISYEDFDAYYRLLKKYVNSNGVDYSIHNYAITLRNVNVRFENPDFDKIGYERIINDLSEIIRKINYMKLCNSCGDWSKVLDYNIEILKNGCVNLDYFNSICTFLRRLITAGVEDARCLELANALLTNKPTGIVSDELEDKYRECCLGLYGIIHVLQNPTKFRNIKAGYNSLNFSEPNGHLGQAQIRKFEMEKIDSTGLAAYWGINLEKAPTI